jgi:hypothetical protein
MNPDASRRDSLKGGTVSAAGLLAAGTAPGLGVDEPVNDQPSHGHEHGNQPYPRDHAGSGGPLGSPTDRGKLATQPP